MCGSWTKILGDAGTKCHQRVIYHFSDMLVEKWLLQKTSLLDIISSMGALTFRLEQFEDKITVLLTCSSLDHTQMQQFAGIKSTVYSDIFWQHVPVWFTINPPINGLIERLVIWSATFGSAFASNASNALDGYLQLLHTMQIAQSAQTESKLHKLYKQLHTLQ